MTINRNLSILAGGVSSTGVLGVPNGGSGATTLTGYLIGNGAGAFTASATIPTTALSGTITNAQLTNSAITINGTSTSLGGSISVGTVTSVAATVPAFLSIAGSPITSSGTLAITLSGTALPIANGGTAQTSFTANQIHYGSFSTSSLLTFDGSNLGVGVALSSWATYKALQVAQDSFISFSGGFGVLQNNAYYNAGYKYITSSFASQFYQQNGAHIWTTAPSGTAGNAITFTEVARIHASGGVSIGNTTDPGAGNLSVNGVIKIGSNQAVNGPAFSAYINADQTVTSTVVTKVTFNNEQFDTNNNFDSTTNYRFTPTIAGYYQVNVTIAGQSTVTLTGLIAYIYKNGASYRLGLIQQTSSNARAGISDLIYMNGSTDYLEIYARCDGTGTLAFAGGTTASSFSAAMVRGA